MILFIDDIREPIAYKNSKEEVVVARNYEQAISALSMYDFTLVSFDHDLGEGKSGYDVAKYIVENKIIIGGFKVHSANPVGKFNIEQLLEHYGYIKLN